MNRNFFSISVVLIILTLLVCGSFIFSAFMTSENTGVLHVKTSSKKAVLSISQTNREAVVVGVGTETIRLAPGEYRVAAIDGESHAVALVTIQKKRVTNSILKLTNTPLLPSVYSVSFNNFDEWISKGFTDTQINNLKIYFFKFKPSARTIALVGDSVYSIMKNPNPSDATHYTNFQVIVDGVVYGGTVGRPSLETVSLILRDPATNTVVFDSSAVNISRGDEGE